jgi:hypothetical protein
VNSTPEPTAPAITERPAFAELLWDLLDNSTVEIDDMIAELDEAIRCLETRREPHTQGDAP